MRLTETWVKIGRDESPARRFAGHQRWESFKEGISCHMPQKWNRFKLLKAVTTLKLAEFSRMKESNSIFLSVYKYHTSESEMISETWRRCKYCKWINFTHLRRRNQLRPWCFSVCTPVWLIGRILKESSHPEEVFASQGVFSATCE